MVDAERAFASASESSKPTPFMALIVLLAIFAAVLLAAGTLLLNTGNDFAWRDASEYVSRLAFLVFIAAMVVEPLSRIFPGRILKAAGRERGSLILAFVLVSIVSLACELVPSELGSVKMALQSFAYAMFTAFILVVMLFSAHPATRKVLGGPAWRTVQRIATAYFWVVFTVTALEHISRPNVTDRWWGISLLLLITAVLISITDTVMVRLRGVATPVSEKVV